MILRNKNPMIVMGSSQLFLSLGIIGLVLLRNLSPESAGAFWGGFLTGLSYSLIGMSAVLNLVGLIRLSKNSLA
jgi:hypothetical protein